MADGTLDPRMISETVNLLHKLIQTRFPASGLAGVADKLCRITERASATSDWIARPIWPLRILVHSLTALIILWTEGYTPKVQWTLSVVILGCWFGFASAVRENVASPLR